MDTRKTIFDKATRIEVVKSLSEKDIMKITLEEFQLSWADLFELEKQVLASILIDFDPTIEHIGSTAIPGLCAKPTIDILVGLPDEIQLDKTIAPMMGACYTYFKKYEPAMPYRRLFAKLRGLTDRKSPARIDVHDAFIRGQEFISFANIHVIVKDSHHWKRHLAFRDYLRAHADKRDEYGRFKAELSEKEYEDTNQYNTAKSHFIKQTQELALAWYENQLNKSGKQPYYGGA